MFAKEPIPKTNSSLCENYLRNLINAVESTTPFEQTKANDWLEKLIKRNCQIYLNWFYRNYRNHPSPFVQSIAEKARK